MKLKATTALLLAAGVLTTPVSFAAETPSKAVELSDCCTPGDKDFPKVGGNLGNRSRRGQATGSPSRSTGNTWAPSATGSRITVSPPSFDTITAPAGEYWRM
jgi:hypothetical protein